MLSLPNYTLTEPLHVGGAHVLHRGYRDADHAPVAVKLLKSEYPSQREIARLRHEYVISREIDAPGVVKAYGLEKVGHGLALILEDFGGRPLDELLLAGKLELSAALDLASSLAEAVGAIHDHHVIHKDIKPHNILVNTETGAVKLTDFGIATRLSQEAQKAARPDALEGTLGYMSPEQTGRMNRALDNRTDLYSLGVTLYEVLSGSLPFATKDPVELVHSHIARTPQPLHERAKGVPEAVSAIVMKLLAKAAEDRYQSAHGLKADLDECRRRLLATGQVAPFPLGKKDVTAELRFTQKLYGREAERAALFAAFGRARAGGAELFLIGGDAGVGKSALVSELYQALARGGGYLAAGRFDRRGRSAPYAAIMTALRELVRHVLAEPAEALVRWKAALLAAVGSNGQLLVDLIPELQLLLGPQPAAPELGPFESQNRFGLVFQNFVRAFTAADHPVVLFLDDLQWADAAERRLLSLLLLDPERGHLLIVGAHRDEPDAGPDLSLAVADLREQGAAVHEITLSPLDVAGAEQLVADALGAEVAGVRPFARLVFEKTQGNPLFMVQFLRTLREGGLLAFDRESGSFRYDLTRVRAAMVTDNVVDFMAAKIKRLAPHTQRALRLAACIGYRFDLKTLSVINETRPPETAATLWEALEQGFVLPLDAGYQLAAEADIQRVTGTLPPQMFDLTYRFLHDRVQQAAYALIEEPRRKEVHLRIGRLLNAQADARKREERLLEIVDHLNIGASLIVDRAERIALARQNLGAGKRAKAATAYQAAAGYLGAGTALLDEASWADEYDLAFALHTERAECEYLNGQFDDAELLFDLALIHARSRLDRARVYTLLVVLYIMRGEFAAALRVSRSGLALFGVDLPETEDGLRAAFDAEIDAVKGNLAGRRFADLIDAPRLTDPDHLAHLELLVKMSPAAFFSGPTITALVTAMPLNLSLKYGQSAMSDLTYSGFGYIGIVTRGWYEEARELFHLGTALAARSTEIRLRSETDVLLLGAAHFFIPLREIVPIAARAQRAGLETGDFVFLSFASYHLIMLRLCAGEELGAVQEELDRCLALMRRTQNALTTATLLVGRQLIAALTGRTESRTSLSDQAFDEADHVARSRAAGFDFAVAYHHFAKLELSVLHGDYPTALEQAALAAETAGSASLFHFLCDVPFYAGLALTGLYLSATAPEQERYAKALREHRDRISLWAELCPANFGHKRLLLDAEEARVTGRDAEARDLYDKAIDSAREAEFTHHEALANELAAMYYIGRGQPRIARLYLDEAHHGYLRWGATEKARALAERHAALLGPASASASRPMAALSATTTSTESAELIDNAAMVRAAQAIVGELDLDRLLDRLMRIVVANAGADRGVLVLAREDRLLIEATMTVDPDIVSVGLGTPLDAGAGLAESVVSFVERTLEPVVLGDAAATGPFSGDAYLASRPPKSLLCLAMAHQGRLAGILYLENHVAREAFTPSMVELSSLLASQAAIAVENALLVDELRRRTAALGESNKAIGEAYEALTAANLALRTTNEQLARELHEREQAEAAREALREELNRVQTPLCPITDRIMVMPLIGTIDAERARQILETALRGVSKSRAAVVILDVTGVEGIDGGVTGTLISTANALRLLGAQAVITGIRPDVARELVALGLDLGALVTRGTLQSGIAYAMERLSGKREAATKQ